MVASSRKIYQTDDELEQVIIDLIRIGSSGSPSGIRQVANRLVRSTPQGIRDVASFREALREALAHATSKPDLRFGAGEVPVDVAGQHPLVDVDPFPDGSGLVLADDVAAEIGYIVDERSRVDELKRAGVGLTRTLLLSGPPGVGKTMTARWLAQQLRLPLVSLDLSSVVSSFLGSSGRNIRSVLDYAKSGSCVLLLDEFDALAKRRDDDTDIGELKRIVNVILVELDRWSDTSLLIAATNHAQLLDEAVDRRFDRHIELRLPDTQERRRILSSLALETDVEPRVLDLVAAISESVSGSDLTRLWRNSHRRAVMCGRALSEELLDNMVSKHIRSGPDRDRLILMMADHMNMSTRQIAQRLGVSHPTVSSALKRVRTRK